MNLRRDTTKHPGRTGGAGRTPSAKSGAATYESRSQRVNSPINRTAKRPPNGARQAKKTCLRTSLRKSPKKNTTENAKKRNKKRKEKCKKTRKTALGEGRRTDSPAAHPVLGGTVLRRLPRDPRLYLCGQEEERKHRDNTRMSSARTHERTCSVQQWRHIHTHVHVTRTVKSANHALARSDAHVRKQQNLNFERSDKKDKP